MIMAFFAGTEHASGHIEVVKYASRSLCGAQGFGTS